MLGAQRERPQESFLGGRAFVQGEAPTGDVAALEVDQGWAGHRDEAGRELGIAGLGVQAEAGRVPRRGEAGRHLVDVLGGQCVEDAFAFGRGKGLGGEEHLDGRGAGERAGHEGGQDAGHTLAAAGPGPFGSERVEQGRARCGIGGGGDGARGGRYLPRGRAAGGGAYREDGGRAPVERRLGEELGAAAGAAVEERGRGRGHLDFHGGSPLVVVGAGAAGAGIDAVEGPADEVDGAVRGRVEGTG